MSSYAGLKLLAIRAILAGSDGWTCTFFVCTDESKDRSGELGRLRGGRLLSVDSFSLASSSCMPKDWEILLNSLSQLSDRSKLPLIVMTPWGPGIFICR